MNQWWFVYWRIYASLGLNELIEPTLRQYDRVLGYKEGTALNLLIAALIKSIIVPLLKTSLNDKIDKKHSSNLNVRRRQYLYR